eukprot:scaffold149_cov315-Pinguiococcus_pyrenoidosus.AAC.33
MPGLRHWLETTLENDPESEALKEILQPDDAQQLQSLAGKLGLLGFLDGMGATRSSELLLRILQSLDHTALSEARSGENGLVHATIRPILLRLARMYIMKVWCRRQWRARIDGGAHHAPQCCRKRKAAACGRWIPLQTSTYETVSSGVRQLMGALVESINWAADPSLQGWKNSYGLMVNYLYELDGIEGRSHAYSIYGDVTVSSSLEQAA